MNLLLGQIDLPALTGDPKAWLTIISGVLVTMIVGRFIQAFRNGAGLIDAAKAVLFGTNIPKPPDDTKPPTGGSPVVGLLLIGLLALGLAGCATLQPGADPLVVRVEQAQTTGKASFDLVLNIDNANRAFYRTNAPGFHAFCEWLRVPTATTDGGTLPRASAMLWTLDREKLAYKTGTGTSNAVVTALTVVIETANQASTWAQTIKTK